MTFKEVMCNNCNKKFSIELRRYNVSLKNNWKFYCCKECKNQSQTTSIYLICANCGKEIIRTPAEIKKNKENFCSRSCAAIFNNKLREHSGWKMSLEAKEKIKTSLVEYHNKNLYIPSIRKCIVCGKEFIPQKLKSGKFSRSKTCCKECHVQLKQRNGLSTYQKCVENGTFKGWQSRNIISYPEKFWTKVLKNNNITFEREKHVDKYFLDFVISINDKLIDLEIDGKQHKYQDRLESDYIRDKFLTSKGYFVYRIEWNEINSNNGKHLMKSKIDEFIKYINSVKEE